MKNTTFIFIRHAESEKNLKDITGGKGEELTKKGIEQTNDLIKNILTKITTEDCSIISSNIIQAQQTAALIANSLNLPCEITTQLKPADMGIINGLTKHEIKTKYPKQYEQLARWRKQEIEACELNVPHMESPQLFWDRILSYIKTICNGGVKIVICTRSVLVLVYNYVHNKNPKPGGGYKHIGIDNCELIAFVADNTGRVHKLINSITSKNLQ